MVAAATHKDVRPVLSVGDSFDPEEIGAVPSNAIVVNQAPPIGVAEAGLGLHYPCRIKYSA
jgi:hypothetical protein